MTVHPEPAQLAQQYGLLYYLAFNSQTDGILMLSDQGQIIELNHACEQIFRINKASVINKSLSEAAGVIHPEIIQYLIKAIGQYSRTTSTVHDEIAVDDNGEEKTFDVSIKATFPDINQNGWIIFIKDVTYRSQVELSAQTSDSKLNQILNSVKEGITLSNQDGQFEIFNREMEKLTGYTQKEANETTNFYEKIHLPEETDQALERLNEIKPGNLINTETTLISKSGDKRIIEVTSSLFTDSKRVQFLSTYHDITHRKKYEEELLKAKANLEQSVIETSQQLSASVNEAEDLSRFPSEDPYPVLRVTPEGIVIFANPASRKLLELWSSGENKPLPEGWSNQVKDVYESNNRKIIEVDFVNQVLSFVMVPVKERGYVNLYGRDVTEQKEIDRMKNEFISLVSHQIRTPLTSIRWYSEMLLNSATSLTSDDKETAQTIHETAISLSNLVNDLLNISRMESGRIPSKSQKSDFIKIVQDTYKQLEPEAITKELNVTLELDEIPTFEFDPQLVREILSNLISNAIKYTPNKGSVRIKAIKKDNAVEWSIADTGIGIPKPAQEHMFQRFYRAQNAVDANIDGTGLGLVVVKMMVDRLGGTIWFESEEGKGTTFYFTLPIRLAQM